jgi:type 1 glutamine amidotransferase
MQVRTALALLAVLLLSCGSDTRSPVQSTPASTTTTTAAPPAIAPIRVLMLTATSGFHHDSIPAARAAVAAIASRATDIVVAATENVADVSATRLAATDVLMFALTTGELAFDESQKRAIVDFVNNGGGFIGFHSATDTLYDWPDYGRIVGAYFKEHPWTQQATVTVEDRVHPTTSGLGASFSLTEEFYTFRTNPRGAAHVLLTLDSASVGAQGDFPLAWTQTIGRGRSYYNALGHFSDTWNDSRFQLQIAAAIRWVSGR